MHLGTRVWARCLDFFTPHCLFFLLARLLISRGLRTCPFLPGLGNDGKKLEGLFFKKISRRKREREKRSVAHERRGRRYGRWVYRHLNRLANLSDSLSS